MKGKQIILLFLALLLPATVFVFLKGFGKNEFEVPPLFTDEAPAVATGCTSPALPYVLDDATMSDWNLSSTDSIGLLYFTDDKLQQGVLRVSQEFQDFPLKFWTLPRDGNIQKMKCIYFLKEPFDLVVVDRNGRIRGQFSSSDREDIDRLKTELAIIFKDY
jgi:hypothetical protein